MPNGQQLAHGAGKRRSQINQSLYSFTNKSILWLTSPQPPTKTFNFHTPTYIRKLEKSKSNRSIRGVTKDLKVPRVRTNYGQRSFRVQGAHLWYSLPEYIKYLPLLSRLKNALCEHLLLFDWDSLSLCASNYYFLTEILYLYFLWMRNSP